MTCLAFNVASPSINGCALRHDAALRRNAANVPFLHQYRVHITRSVIPFAHDATRGVTETTVLWAPLPAVLY